jgi:uncharacterized protein involved in response to NO
MTKAMLRPGSAETAPLGRLGFRPFFLGGAGFAVLAVTR